MKKLLLLFVPILAAVAAAAQPTLLNSLNSAVPGDKFYLRYCNTAGIDKGPSGAGVTWDLSALKQIDLDSMEYGPCTGTPYCDSFPGSNLSVNYGGGYYEYYVADTNQFAQTGDGDPSFKEYYTDPFALMKYPMTYGTSVVDTLFIADYVDGYYSYGNDSMNGDAYGTLILPTGTYTDVVRVRMKFFVVDSDVSVSPPAIDTSVLEVYMWWTPGFHSPLLAMSYDTSFGGTLQDVIYYTKPVPPPVPTAVKPLTTNEDIQVYPNPASGIAHLKFSALNKGTAIISAMDMLGRTRGDVVTAKFDKGSNDISYPVGSLPSGVYLLRIQSDGNTIFKKIEVVN